MSSPAGHPNARAQAQRNGNTYDPVDARYRPPFGPLVVQPTPPDRESAASSTSVARPCHVDGTIRPPFTYRGSTAHVESDARAGADQRSSEEITVAASTLLRQASVTRCKRRLPNSLQVGGRNQSTGRRKQSTVESITRSRGHGTCRRRVRERCHLGPLRCALLVRAPTRCLEHTLQATGMKQCRWA